MNPDDPLDHVDLENEIRRVVDQYRSHRESYWSHDRHVLKILIEKSKLDLPVLPPKHGRYIVQMLPKGLRVPLQGDLEEDYPEWVAEFGIKKADKLYRTEIYTAILERLMDQLSLWKTLGKAVALIILLTIWKLLR